MGLTPRDYQIAAAEAAISFISHSKEPCLLQLGTGAGKSIIISLIVRRIKESGGKGILVIAPSKELVEQDYWKYINFGFDAGMYSASAGRRKDISSVTFGTPLSVLNSIKSIIAAQPYSAVIIDEAHGMTPTIARIIGELRGANQNLRVIGLTATPHQTGKGFIYRFDENDCRLPSEQAREPFFHKLVFRMTERELISRGFLTPPEFYSGGLHYAGESLKLDSKGNFNAEDVRTVFEGQRLTSQIVADALAKAAPMLSRGLNVLWFAATVAHTIEIQDALAGHAAVVVTGDTPKKERESIIEAFRRGEIRHLINVGVLTTGFDAPNVGVVAILRATESLRLLLQIIGRGMRLYDNKNNFLVLDYAENIERHADGGDLLEAKPKTREEYNAKKADICCPKCGHSNRFGMKPNPEGFALSPDGYFVSSLGDRIIHPDWGYPIASHYGRKCQSEGCDHRWNSKKCHSCGTENDIAARVCHTCNDELVDPNEKLVLHMAAKRKEVAIEEVEVISAKIALSMNGRPQIVYHTTGGTVYEVFFQPRVAWQFDDLAKRLRRYGLSLSSKSVSSSDLLQKLNEIKMFPRRLFIKKDKESDFKKIVDVIFS